MVISSIKPYKLYSPFPYSPPTPRIPMTRVLKIIPAQESERENKE